MQGGGGQWVKKRMSIILSTMKNIFKKAQSKKKKIKRFIYFFIFTVIRGSKWKLKLYPNILVNKNNLSETETELKWAFLVTR